VLGKFLAAWIFIGVALVLTGTNWISVSYLGNPDHGVILAGYVGSFLMAGAYLSIGSLVSSFTKNQVIAFVVSLIACLLFFLAGQPGVIDVAHTFLPESMVEWVRSMSLLTHFNAISRGVLDFRDIIFFLSFIGLLLFANAIVVDHYKAR